MRIDGEFRSRVLSGAPLAGTWLNLGSPITAEMAGLCGFDWVLLDHEHGPGTDSTIVQQLQAVRRLRPWPWSASPSMSRPASSVSSTPAPAG